jgi:hypothetical protein
LAQIEHEVADTASDRLVSAKGTAVTALAILRQWAKDAEANDDGDGDAGGR